MSRSVRTPAVRTPGAVQQSLATLRLGKRDLAILIAYFAMICFAIHFHQPVEDEGRAWILSRSVGIYQLVFHMLRYEGHPPLWYLLLWLPTHLRMPFLYIEWLSAAIACAGIYVLLRFSPFPFYLRALLPFGFALGYQYSVVARSYVLFPLLGFVVAHLYRRKDSMPIAMAIALGLLANVSIHGTLVAIGFAVAYAMDLMAKQRRSELAARQRKALLLGAALFAAAVLLAAVCVWPAKYLDMPLTTTFEKLLHRAVDPLLGPAWIHRHANGPADVAPQEGGRPPASPDAGAGTISLDSLSMQDLYKQRLAYRLPLVFEYPLAAFHPLALLFEGLVLLYLYQRARMLLILPIALLAYFLVAVWTEVWHTGLMWVTLLLVLWAAWDSPIVRRVVGRAPFGLETVDLQKAVACLLALLCVLQLSWTVAAIRYETQHATYPARATAAYLATLPADRPMDGNGNATSVLPYFLDRGFIDNGSGRFTHHGAYPPPYSVADFLHEGAEIIVLPGTEVSPEKKVELAGAGYRREHRFCGAPYFPQQPVIPLCLFVFENN